MEEKEKELEEQEEIQEPEAETGKPPEKNGWQFWLLAAGQVVTVLLLITAMIQNRSLMRQVESMRQEINSSISIMHSDIGGRISGISGSVQNALEQQTKILADHSYELLDFQRTDKTVGIRLAATPRQFTEDTKLSFLYTCDDGTQHRVEGVREGSGYTFTAAIRVPAKTSCVSVSVALEQNGATMLEQTDYIYETASFGLLDVSFALSTGQSGYDQSAGAWDLDLELQVGIGSYWEGTDMPRLSSAEIQVWADGAMTARVPFEGAQEYLQPGRDGNIPKLEGITNFYQQMKGSYPANQELEIRVVVMDSNGTRYSSSPFYMIRGTNGEWGPEESKADVTIE